MTETIDGEAVELPSAVAVIQPERGLAVAESPKAMIALASELADALKDIVERQKLYAVIQGKKYPQVEAWMTIGRMDNVVAREVPGGVLRMEDGSYEGTVELIRLSDGMVIGRASALCGTPDDKPWATRSEPARRSMAVTRATSRAFRQQYSWIMALAGYEPTPADEMPPQGDTPPAAPARPPADPTAPWLDQTDVTRTGVVSLGSPPMDGNLRETVEGPLVGFKLNVDDGTKIPQVALSGALALAAASEGSLDGQTVTASGDLWRVPWAKAGQRMPAFQRLVVTRLETPDWTIPKPEALERPEPSPEPVAAASPTPDTLNPPRPDCAAVDPLTGALCLMETHKPRLAHKGADPETGELMTWT